MIRPWLMALGGVIQRDALIFMSYRTTALSRMLSAIFSLVTFYYISRLVQVGSFDQSQYFGFVVVGLFILQVLTSTMVTGPTSVRQELVAGTFERFLVSPFGAVSGILSMLVFPTLVALFMGTFMIAVADLVFGLSIAWKTAPLAIPAALLGAAAFVPLALIFVSAVVAFKQALPGSQFVVAGMAIIGGLYFPITLLPDWVEPLSELQPLTPAADLLRHLISGAPLDDPLLPVLKLAAFAVILAPLSLGLLTLAVRRGKARGTILEY